MSNTSVGTISLNMVLNSAGFKRSIQNAQSQVNASSQKMAASFKKVGAAIAATFSAAMIKKFGQECITAANVQTEAETKLTTVMKQRMKATDKGIQKIKDYASAQQELGVVGDEVQLSGAQQLSTFLQTEDALKTLIPAMNNLAVQQNGVNIGTSSMVNIGNLMGKVMQGQTSALTRVGITFTEAQEKVLKYGNEQERAAMLAQVITDNVGEMNKAIANTPAGQIQKIKNSFGDMQEILGRSLQNVFAPLLKYLNSAVSKFSELALKFEEFTQKVFGNANRTAVATNGAISDTANSVSSLTDEAENSTSALDGIADSAEKAKRSVAGFDKLNILSKPEKTETNSTTPTSSNQTASSTGGLASIMSKSFDKLNIKSQKVIDSIKKSFGSMKGVIISIGASWSRVWNNGSGEKLLNKIKDLLKHCFENVGFIADAFKNAWDKAGLGDGVIQSIINRASSLVGLADTIAESFGKVWNSGVGERIWSNILNIIKNCNNYVSTLRDKIKLAWEKGGAGEKIWGTILGIVEDITGFLNGMSQIRLDWLESLDLSPIVTAVSKLGGAFRELLNACGDKLKTAYKNILLPLSKWTIEKAVPKLVETLSKALKGFSDIIKKISDKTLYAIAGGITALGSAIIIFKAGQAIANGILKVKTAMSLLITTLKAHPLLAIASAIGAVVTAVATYNELEWSNSEAGKFAAEIDTIKGQLEETTTGITETLENTFETLDNMYADNTLIDDYQKKLEELLGKAELTPEEQSQLQTIVTYFNNNVDGFKDTWNKYVETSKDGKVNLKGDLAEIQSEIDKTIDEYQRLANQTALSEMYNKNAKEKIPANQKLIETRESLEKKQDDLDKAEEEFNTYLKEKNLSKERYIQLYNSENGGYYRRTGGDYYKKVCEESNALKELKDTYNKCVAEVNKLTMTNDDLLDVQKVLNGDYSDAAAVFMAYKNGMISLEDVQKSQWKSIANLENAAKDSGKNTILGLVEGAEEYKGALVENSNGLANLVLSEYDRGMGINSPSKEMHKRGVYTVEGLVNGIADSESKLKTPLQSIVDKFKSLWQRIKGIFTDGDGFVKIKEAIWGIFKNAINALITGINSLIKKPFDMLNTAFDNVRNFKFFGKTVFDWLPKINAPQIPKLAKGGIIKAPTLAVVGDNAGANTGNPEVVAPLNKLQSMINTSSGQDVVILAKILDYLKRLYEMFVIFRNNGGNHYEFIAKINGSDIFNEIVKQNELYKKRHNGKSAFA